MHIFKGSFLLENNLHNFSCVCCKYITAYLFTGTCVSTPRFIHACMSVTNVLLLYCEMNMNSVKFKNEMIQDGRSKMGSACPPLPVIIQEFIIKTLYNLTIMT